MLTRVLVEPKSEPEDTIYTKLANTDCSNHVRIHGKASMLIGLSFLLFATFLLFLFINSDMFIWLLT